jgi:protein-S-isoprenylcysteine O-methyltransferase Ste14
MKILDSIVSLYYRSATGRLRSRNLLAVMGFIIFSAAVILFIIISLQFDKILGFPKFLDKGLANIISYPIMGIGLAVIIWCIVHFLNAKGTPVPFLPPKSLVTRGPYSFSRNPMVSGLIIFMFGFGIFAQSISLTFIFVPVFIFLSYLELKLIEEPELEKRLGNDYIEYKKKVPMMIPGFFRKR